MLTLNDTKKIQRKLHLLTVSNPKMLKSLEQGYLSAILHLSPADSSGYEVCTGRSPQCTIACLGHGYIASMDNVRDARIRKTKLLFDDPVTFRALLTADIAYLQTITHAHKVKFTLRLNGTSDLPWHLPKYGSIYQTYPNIQFIEYTKIPGIALALNKLSNVSVVFSRSETNQKQTRAMLARNINVAAIFSGEKPSHMHGYPVIDGDISDLRHLDPPNVIVGLKLKTSYSKKRGKLRKNEHVKNGFVLHYDGIAA